MLLVSLSMKMPFLTLNSNSESPPRRKKLEKWAIFRDSGSFDAINEYLSDEEHAEMA